MVTLTETTVEELHATVQTTHRHGLDVFILVTASEQRSIADLLFRPSLRSQLLLLFPAHFTPVRLLTLPYLAGHTEHSRRSETNFVYRRQLV